MSEWGPVGSTEERRAARQARRDARRAALGGVIGVGSVTGRLVFGLVLLTLGVLWTLDNLDVLDADRILRWWPVLIVGWGVVRLFGLDGCRRPLAGAILTLAGVVLLLGTAGLASSTFDLWPLLLVAVGATVLLRSLRPAAPAGVETGTASAVHTFAFLSGHKVRTETERFEGGDASAVMGGCEIDMRAARPAGERIVIELLVWWGGINLFIPPDWHVVSEATVLLGGIEDATRAPGSAGGPTLVLRGLVIMGGVEVKN
jgi:hypothetical protein